MFGLIGVILLLLVIGSFILPWLHHSEIKTLKRQIQNYSSKNTSRSSSRDFASQSLSHISNAIFLRQKKLLLAFFKPKEKHDSLDPLPLQTKPMIPTAPIKAIKIEHHTEDFTKSDMEQNLGMKLPVWIGGIAFALAGFYLIKYSLDNNLISPLVRLLLSGILGISLLATARYLWHKTQTDRRIPQSLAGAGIAILYFVSFASVKLYNILPHSIGFASMAIITLFALILSLRYGTAIALMGIVSGFITPALMSNGTGDAVALFSYLSIMNIAFMVIAYQNNNLWLSCLSVFGSGFWVLLWTFFTGHDGDDKIIIGFLMLLSVGATASIYKQSKNHDLSYVNYSFLGIPLALILFSTDIAHIDAIEWGLFSILGLMSIGLAYFNARLYSLAPYATMTLTGILFFVWEDYTINSVLILTAILLTIYGGISLYFSTRANPPLLWTRLFTLSSLGLFLISYCKIGLFLPSYYQLEHVDINKSYLSYSYALIGLIFAGGLISFLKNMKNLYQDHTDIPKIEAVCAIVINAFLSSSLFIILPPEFFKTALCVQILSVAWVYYKLSLPTLRKIILALTGVFILMSLENLMTIGDIIDNSSYIKHYSYLNVLLYFFVPTLVFAGTSYYLRKQENNYHVSLFEYFSVFFAMLGGYYFIRNLYIELHLFQKQDIHDYYNNLTTYYSSNFLFSERSLLLNLPLGLGVALLYIEKKYNASLSMWGEYKGHNALKNSANFLFIAGLVIIILGNIFLHNPLWNYEKIFGITIFNSLLIGYALPILWIYLWNKQRPHSYYSGLMLIFSLVLISLNIRFFFSENGYLSSSHSEIEIYSHSVIWLIYGIILLFFGITKEDKFLRKASLAVIFLTVTKVFLYDASELEGLYRVASFFGLGLTLMGLSFVYTKLVPHQKRP